VQRAIQSRGAFCLDRTNGTRAQLRPRLFLEPPAPRCVHLDVDAGKDTLARVRAGLLCARPPDKPPRSRALPLPFFACWSDLRVTSKHLI
jgi:hypothetical protein